MQLADFTFGVAGHFTRDFVGGYVTTVRIDNKDRVWSQLNQFLVVDLRFRAARSGVLGRWGAICPDSGVGC
ncbi:MAG: hypothetical protein IID35_10930 [Planctomycetes bacterium]|nr:hypothetical protein [Planctomycetota bacterium]